MTQTGNQAAQPPQVVRRARLKMLAILFVCAVPVIASYFTYYVIRPEGRTNYGDLVQPLRELPELGARDTQGQPASLSTLRGRWVMLVVAPGACDDACRQRLYEIRQVRLTTGKDRDRVERLWLVDDAQQPDPQLLAQHEGLHVWHAPRAAITAALPVTAATQAQDHIWVIDPLGNVMMRFPSNADPSKMKKDLAKLLRASRVG
ncbi:MAG: cytochrome C oxidase subunit I [Burkholderiales bacterium]|nr:cytochrome C oxidase subunit I [Burkholderiales bacterium]